ncbi:nucleoside diphosphate kinase regulator [Pelagerythrobacter marinus]|uniref:nucleoside diphosphate kinase regulator n=1 Tax=Pelagerythrobacter marinus TaxID=538382 RepID=UPI0020371CFA|nr:nucleoside diphosphate kinase regulator [Pelagerythrobacter marinus]USA38437.1 nucleoside diphosphate kinase regulator [Pelagerythrobacter marinus]WPZ07539.1 nucleoside diphosphate kinase regulator [Pelagerythrobacter marinus]
MTSTKAAVRPPITLAESEADTLADLALAMQGRQPEVSRLLLEEIDRARTVPAGRVPRDVVTMGSTVVFVVRETGERRTITLVYPGEADISQGRLSILTPVGAGLLGLRVGQEISWPDRSGEDRLLAIESVDRPG